MENTSKNKSKSTLQAEDIGIINYLIYNNIKTIAFRNKNIKNTQELDKAINRAEGYISKKGNNNKSIFNLGVLIEIANYLDCDLKELVVDVRGILNKEEE